MYREGELDIICNVGIATTGTDLPDTRCIIQNFATTSLVKHVQTLGRGARASEGKDNFVVIDMGRNYIRHGEFGEDIDWAHIFNNPSEATKKREKKEKRECGECGAVIRFHLQTCPYCGDFISKKEIEDKLLAGATTEEVRAYRIKHLSPHLRRPLNQLNDADLREYGRQMGYKPNWYWTIRNKLKR
jgi:superfamily II DNA or RNA helicase